MKKFLLTPVFLLVFLCSLHAQAPDPHSFVTEVMRFEKDSVKPFLLRDSAVSHFYPDWESDSTMLAGLKNELGADADYMLKQRMEFKPQVWDASKIKGATSLGEAYYKKTFSGKKQVKNWEKYYAVHKAGYYEISTPVFSRDGKTAILYMAYHCGTTCGHGGASLYRFENGKWKEVRSLFAWIKN
ncbi:MAG: hypothetical protein FD123_977 [Bacteroidetes bacterium]|nr:MAG: hypothetical protein FD123_977 [Bacteroidota bacterium]